jgi:hypothetical protein
MFLRCSAPIDEMQLDIHCVNIPKPRKVIEVRVIADQEAGKVLLRSHGVVAMNPLSHQISKANAFVNVGLMRVFLSISRVSARSRP